MATRVKLNIYTHTAGTFSYITDDESASAIMEQFNSRTDGRVEIKGTISHIDSNMVEAAFDLERIECMEIVEIKTI